MSPMPPKMAPRRHKLLTADLRAKLPALYATEETPLEDKVVVVKFFNPYGRATWWAVEGSSEMDEAGNEEDFTFFGAVDLGMTDAPEWGYFTLSEIETTAVRFGGYLLPLERDCSWTPKPWAEAHARL